MDAYTRDTEPTKAQPELAEWHKSAVEEAQTLWSHLVKYFESCYYITKSLNSLISIHDMYLDTTPPVLLELRNKIQKELPYKSYAPIERLAKGVALPIGRPNEDNE